ncbi:hypothetical protein OKW42_003970 [Paraburkholderia sp. WC7.3d]
MPQDQEYSIPNIDRRDSSPIDLICEALVARGVMRFGGDGYVVVIDLGKHAGVNPSKQETEGNFFGDYTGAKGARNGKRRPVLHIAVTIFPSREFRFGSIYVRADRDIDKPEDLKGKRIGVPECRPNCLVSSSKCNTLNEIGCCDEEELQASECGRTRGDHDRTSEGWQHTNSRATAQIDRRQRALSAYA